jgi:Xaa-Pro aminopeptidase
MYDDRARRLKESIGQSELDAFAIIPSPTLFYLTGLSFHLMERPVVAFFRSEDQPILVLPKLELSKAESGVVDFIFFAYEEDVQSFQKLRAVWLISSSLPMKKMFNHELMLLWLPQMSWGVECVNWG